MVNRSDRETSGPEYDAWRSAIRRCTVPADESYRNYGARGIRVHEAWMDSGGFTRFLAHIGRRPSPNHQLDRIDNDGVDPEYWTSTTDVLAAPASAAPDSDAKPSETLLVKAKDVLSTVVRMRVSGSSDGLLSSALFSLNEAEELLLREVERRVTERRRRR